MAYNAPISDTFTLSESVPLSGLAKLMRASGASKAERLYSVPQKPSRPAPSGEGLGGASVRPSGNLQFLLIPKAVHVYSCRRGSPEDSFRSQNDRRITSEPVGRLGKVRDCKETWAPFCSVRAIDARSRRPSFVLPRRRRPTAAFELLQG